MTLRDQVLFASLPYAAVALAAAGLLVRVLGPAGEAAPEAPALPATLRPRVRWARPAWAGGLGLLLVFHLLILLAPAAAAPWSRTPAALALCEVLGLAAAGLALAGLAGEGLAAVRRARTAAAADGLLLALLVLELASGLAVALAYRWGAAWSAVTLTPYLASLLRLRPEVELAAGLPALVRLHLLGGFAVLAVLPFSRAGAALVRPLVRLRGHLTPRRARAGLAE